MSKLTFCLLHLLSTKRLSVSNFKTQKKSIFRGEFLKPGIRQSLNLGTIILTFLSSVDSTLNRIHSFFYYVLFNLKSQDCQTKYDSVFFQPHLEPGLRPKIAIIQKILYLRQFWSIYDFSGK